VNKNISKKNASSYSILICITIFLSIISLSGCVENQNNVGQNLSKFIGTWTGNLEIPMFGGSNNTTINKLVFTETYVTAYLTSERGTFSMNYSYKTEGDKLTLEPEIFNNGGPSNRQSFNHSLPFNDTQPPYNGTWPPNGTMPPNNTWSHNGTRPYDGGQFPYNQRPNMTTTFDYSFNEEFNVLYLNDSQFIKIQ
jgi:hypothetical protein